ncbi:hypothetical protein FEM48_Zijuj03G0145800 [Ziziphus jujuba var. spinosa]|uniref:Protein kinase domain-containing protein n=1 Tax=Ziziphus jujuba var. spinosa TaxID=714518 RepID=A0A978VQW1_ZIZJJ|nr:hypothetical protein FEM48_Zijuj03G0145800 [Ziziphus jujuba var. spinosa]
MPSRQIPIVPAPSPSPTIHHRTIRPAAAVTAAATATAFSLLFFLALCFRKTRKRTAPEADSKPPHRFSYSILRRATDSFAASRRLGQGGFGPVFYGILPKPRQEIAVKLMDSGSLQGEREFQNELFFASMLDSKHVLSVLVENQIEIAVEGSDGAKINGGLETKKEDLESNGGGGVDDYGSVVEETESVTTGFEDLNLGFDLSPSPATAVSASPEAAGLVASPEEFEKLSTLEGGNFDKASPETFEKLISEGNYDKTSMEGGKQNAKKDWWWKQENSGVKDYVMEWIGTEIKNERPNSNWTATASTSSNLSGKADKKKNRKQLDWWMSMEDVKNPKKEKEKKEKRRPAREWWKEEYCEELAKKKKKKMKHQKGMNNIDNGDEWWLQDDELCVDRKKKNRSRSWGSKSSIDWWLDGLSGELWRGRRNTSHDSASGEIPKSGGISSTPSMRGTVCYVAPEYGFGENPSDKCDVYSFGVLLLVLIAGRRPLQVTNSPLSEYQRANLLSWARHLARAGKLIDLVDKSIQSLDQQQAVLCITVALLCLQKSPARRPSMNEVVAMLSGELELPQLPPELSPSPHPRFPFKSHKRVR